MTVLSQVRPAWRSLRRRPAFSLLAIGILALGIGANTAIFSIVNAVMVRSLPFGDEDSLYLVFADGTARGQGQRGAVTAGDYSDWSAETRSFTALAALRNESRRVTNIDTPLVPLVHAVTANYFDVVRPPMLLGRGFLPGEDAPGRDPVVVLTYPLWQSAFGSDPSLVGKTIELDGRAHTVVGVLRPEYYSVHGFATQPGLLVPSPISSLREERNTRDLIVYGRLAKDRTEAQALEEMKTIASRLAAAHPDTNDRWGASMMPVREYVVGGFSRTGGILLVAAALVLLIACANVANLMLARAAERSRELALRAALGANRTRLTSQLLTESLLLSAIGGVCGAGLAWFAAQPMARLIPAQAGVPFLDRVTIDGSVLLFTILTTAAAGIIFGLVPAREATRGDLVASLRESGKGAISAPSRKLRSLIVVSEVGLAVIIAAAAGLMARSFAGLSGLSPGFDADRILKLRTSLRGEEFATPSSRLVHFERLRDRLRELPGVASVSAVSFEPPIVGVGGFGSVKLSIAGRVDDAKNAANAVSRSVMPDYFETMGIAVQKGRGILREDAGDTRRVAVITRAMETKYFPDGALGRTFMVQGPRPDPIEIVGVVGDVATAGIDPTPLPVFYTAYAQNPIPIMSFVMRVPKGDPASLGALAEKAAWSGSTSTNVYAVETLAARVGDLNWLTRFGAVLLGGFAFMAVALGIAGIYAVFSYSVLQQRTEIGLRMALGATRGAIIGRVLGGGMRLALAGLAVGLAGSLIATRALRGMLYGVGPNDPVTLGAVSLVLLIATVIGCAAPAFRASRVDPMTALRDS